MQGGSVMSQDETYFAARATEERRLAMASTNPKVRRIHLRMAATYASLAGEDSASDAEVREKLEQRTA